MLGLEMLQRANFAALKGNSPAIDTIHDNAPVMIMPMDPGLG